MSAADPTHTTVPFHFPPHATRPTLLRAFAILGPISNANTLPDDSAVIGFHALTLDPAAVTPSLKGKEPARENVLTANPKRTLAVFKTEDGGRGVAKLIEPGDLLILGCPLKFQAMEEGLALRVEEGDEVWVVKAREAGRVREAVEEWAARFSSREVRCYNCDRGIGEEKVEVEVDVEPVQEIGVELPEVPKEFVKGLARCSRCKVVYYCSKDCQKVNWKEMHKHSCQFLGSAVWFRDSDWGKFLKAIHAVRTGLQELVDEIKSIKEINI